MVHVYPWKSDWCFTNRAYQNACRFNSLDCIGQFVLYMVIQRHMLADISEHMFLNNVLPDLKKLVVD